MSSIKLPGQYLESMSYGPPEPVAMAEKMILAIKHHPQRRISDTLVIGNHIFIPHPSNAI